MLGAEVSIGVLIVLAIKIQEVLCYIPKVRGRLTWPKHVACSLHLGGVHVSWHMAGRLMRNDSYLIILKRGLHM